MLYLKKKFFSGCMFFSVYVPLTIDVENKKKKYKLKMKSFPYLILYIDEK